MIISHISKKLLYYRMCVHVWDFTLACYKDNITAGIVIDEENVNGLGAPVAEIFFE